MKIKFGIIGCGSIAEKAFIPALDKADFAELIVVASRDVNKAKAFSNKFGCDYTNDYDSLLARDDIDAVYIATIPSSHESIIIKCAKNRKHVLCEKPLTISLNSAIKIVKYCKKYNVKVFEGFMYQFHSQHKRLREIINTGKIGKPILFQAQFGIPELNKNNFRYKKNLGGGALLDVGCYTIHSARHFFNAEPVTYHSVINNNKNHVDFHGSLLFNFSDNQTAQLAYGFNNYYRNTYSIWGTDGLITLKRAFSIPPSESPVIQLEQQDYFEEIICDPDDQFKNEIDYFSSMILNNKIENEWNDEILLQAKLIDDIQKAH